MPEFEEEYTKDIVGKNNEWEVEYKVYSHYTEFDVYPFHMDDSGDRHYGETVPFGKKEEVKPFMHGTVKWDGCINYDYKDDCMLHGCSLSDLEDYGLLLTAVYKEALVQIPHVDGSVIEWETT